MELKQRAVYPKMACDGLLIIKRKSGAPTRAPYRGFTLLEVLVSIGVIAVISVVIVQVFFTTTRSNTKSELLKDVKQNGDFAIEVMGRMIRSARSVASPCVSGGTTSSSLSIVNPDGGTTTFGCELDGTVTRIASTSAAAPTQPAYLTSNNLTLGDTCAAGGVTFVCIQGGGISPTVGITFTILQKGSPLGQFERSSATFRTTVTLRN